MALELVYNFFAQARTINFIKWTYLYLRQRLLVWSYIDCQSTTIWLKKILSVWLFECYLQFTESNLTIYASWWGDWEMECAGRLLGSKNLCKCLIALQEVKKNIQCVPLSTQEINVYKYTSTNTILYFAYLKFCERNRFSNLNKYLQQHLINR